MADNEKQSEALIAALAPKIAEAILPKITESVESQMKGLKDKNEELLDKLVKQREQSDFDKLHESSKKLNDSVERERMDRRLGTSFDLNAATRPVQLSKSDARNVQKYRAAKAEATKRGVSLEIVPDD